MRLAVVSPSVDRRHGTERALAEQLERLARDHHCEIHLYAQRVEDLPLIRVEPPRAESAGVIFWHRVPSIPGPHLLQFFGWLFLNSLWRAWDRAVQRLRFDLVLSPGINCLDADVVIVHALFCRLQQLSREDEPEIPTAGWFLRLHRRAYYGLLARLERRLYASPEVSLAAVSLRTAQAIDTLFHRPDVSTIPNAVDTAQFSPAARLARREETRLRDGFQESDLVLLLIGNDWRVKGLPAILRALRTLPDLPVHVIAAGGDSPAPFEECARQFGIAQRCHFEGHRSDVLDLYAAADLYVSPSLEDSFGLPVAEAMACGLPVITSPFAGVSELIQDGVDGFILRDPRDERTLANLLTRLLPEKEIRKHVGEAAAKSAREWTWDRNAARVWQLLQEADRKKRSSHAS